MHGLTNAQGSLLVVGVADPVLRSLIKSGSTLIGMGLGLCIILRVEKIGVGESATLEETLHLNLLVAVRVWNERRALTRNFNVGVEEFANCKSSSIDGLDMLDEVTVRGVE